MAIVSNFCVRSFEIYCLYHFYLKQKRIGPLSTIVLIGYADCLIARFNEQFLSTFRNYYFLTEMFSYRFHLLVIRKKWMELSPNPSFVLKVIETIFNNFFLSFDTTISSKFIHVFQYIIIFLSFIVYRKWCKA